MRKFAVWSTLISQILIVFTGAVVRLTGSGLGCPTWPNCTAESLVTVPEQGIHGLIEFGNRLLTFVLGIVAVLTIIAFWKTTERALAIAIFAGIPLQAVIGGISVWTNLNPWVVGLHFVASALMIALSTSLFWRFTKTTIAPVSSAQLLLSRFIVGFGFLAVLIGVLVTGAGPHAGDAKSPRNGLVLELWQHFHSYPAYITLALVAVQLYLIRNVARLRSIYAWLLAVLALQALVGVVQARLGVPPTLVGIHVLGAAVLCSLLWLQALATKSE